MNTPRRPMKTPRRPVTATVRPARSRRARGRAWLVGLAALPLALAPSLASACAVCTAGRDEENAFAFLMTTIFMSIMPLAAIGTLVFVLWRRIRKLEQEAETPRPTTDTEPRTRAPHGVPQPVSRPIS